MDDEHAKADAIIQDLPNQIARVRARLEEARLKLAPQKKAPDDSKAGA